MNQIIKVTLINGQVLDVDDFINKIIVDLNDDFPELDEELVLSQLNIIYYGKKKELSAEGLRIREFVDVQFSI